MVNQPSLPNSGTERRNAFPRLVRDALAHLYDRPYLQSHGLAKLLCDQRSIAQRDAGRELERLISQRIEMLRPADSAPGAADSAAWRRYELFRLRYVDALDVPAVCDRLGVSQSEFYRQHRVALDAVTVSLEADFTAPVVAPMAGPVEKPPPVSVIDVDQFVGVTPLVDRTETLGLLQSQYDAVAGTGKGHFVFIGGEPGVGKSRLAEEVGRYASRNGGIFLKGQYLREERGPYLPWVDILHTGLRDLDPAEQARLIGPYGADLARLLPDLPSTPGRGAQAEESADESRQRLFDGISSVLTGLSHRAPLVVQIDDLQWSRSLGVLAHVARRLDESRMLLVGTYRAYEFELQERLVQQRQDLSRARVLTALSLEPLGAEDATEMVAISLGRPVAEHLAAGVYRSTHGNPLFIEEVVNALRERGVIRSGISGWEVVEGSQVDLPASLGPLVRERIGRLGEGAEEVFSQAAVLGSEFAFTVLGELTGMAEEELLELVESAMAVHLLVDRSTPGEERFAFADDQFQEVLYQRLTAPRRRRLHLQAGRAMEKVHQSNLVAVSGELARHLVHSSDRSELARALEYAQTAAREDESVHAYVQAAGHWDLALTIQNAIDPRDLVKRCDLALAVASARMIAREAPEEVERAAERAFGLAEALGDPIRASRACQVVTAPAALDGGAPRFGTALWRRWTERADTYAAPSTIDRVHADLALAAVHESEGNLKDDREALVRALELARHLDDQESFFVSAARLLRRTAPQHWEQTARLAAEVAVRRREDVSLGALSWILRTFTYAHAANGERGKLLAVIGEIRERADRTRDPLLILDALYGEALLAQIEGRLEGAVEIGRRIVERSQELGRPGWGARLSANTIFRPLLHLGRGDEALAALVGAGPWLETGEPLADTIRRAVALANLGRVAEAYAVLSQQLSQRDLGRNDDETFTGGLAELLETAVLVQHREAADLLMHRLAALGKTASAGGWTFTSVGRHLGAAAAFLGDVPAARRYYNDALEACQNLGFRPEVALIRLQLGELLARQKDPASDHHLEFAAREFEEMSMGPALARATGLLGRQA